jgi:hypothetical protein
MVSYVLRVKAKLFFSAEDITSLSREFLVDKEVIWEPSNRQIGVFVDTKRLDLCHLITALANRCAGYRT